MQVYQKLVNAILTERNCCLINTSTMDQTKYSSEPRFATIRQTEIQPSPIVHFYWLIEKIIPGTKLQINQQRIYLLEQLLLAPLAPV